MRKLLFLMATVTMAAQAQSGNYSFVEMSVKGAGASLDVRNAGGSVFMPPAGSAVAVPAFCTCYIGEGAGPALLGTVPGPTLASSGLVTPLSGAQPLVLHNNTAANLLLATAVDGTNFDLFVALRQPTAAIQPIGTFTGAYFSIVNGQANGLTSAMVDFTSDGAGHWNNVTITGHTSLRDDLNRAEQPTGVTYSIDASGNGVVTFPPGSDYISGPREFMMSADGNWIIGYGRGAGQRDIFIARLHDPGRSVDQLQGLYWISELGAETPFAFDASAVRFSSATGTMRADGVSRAEFAEQLARQRTVANGGGAALSWLYTANAYYSSSTGAAALVPAPTSNQTQENFNFSNDGFLGAHVGIVGNVTLEHGIWVGTTVQSAIADPTPAPWITPNGIVNAASFAVGPAAPLGYFSIFGVGLAGSTATPTTSPLPTQLAGTRVLVNGQPVPLSLASSSQVNFEWPANVNSGTATVQVATSIGTTSAATLTAAAVSPAIFPGAIVHANYSPVNGSAPAKPGETILIFATGLGPVNPPIDAGVAAPAAPLVRTADPSLLVSVAGEQCIVGFSGLAPGFAGLYQLNVEVPTDAVAANAAPVGIVVMGAFTDLGEIVIQP